MKTIVLTHTSRLYGSKIVSVKSCITHSVSGEATYTLYLLSNSHVGLDQQFELHCNVTPLPRSEITHTR